MCDFSRHLSPLTTDFLAVTLSVIDGTGAIYLRCHEQSVARTRSEFHHVRREPRCAILRCALTGYFGHCSYDDGDALMIFNLLSHTCETWSNAAVQASTTVCRRAELFIGSLTLRGHSPPLLEGGRSSNVTHLKKQIRNFVLRFLNIVRKKKCAHVL